MSTWVIPEETSSRMCLNMTAISTTPSLLWMNIDFVEGCLSARKPSESVIVQYIGFHISG